MRVTILSSLLVADAFDLCRHATLAVATSRQGPPAQEITVEDVTPLVQDFVADCGLREGLVTVISQHTTTGVTINEYEARLATDLRAWLLKLAPPDDRSAVGSDHRGIAYAHNDIDQRPDGDAERQRCIENGWDIDDPHVLKAWRAQEPINAHSHLTAMLLGSSETVPVADGKLQLGQWQSIMLVDLDGPRDRKLGITALGLSSVAG